MDDECLPRALAEKKQITARARRLARVVMHWKRQTGQYHAVDRARRRLTLMRRENADDTKLTVNLPSVRIIMASDDT